MDNYESMKRVSTNYKAKKEEMRKHESKQKLVECVKSRIRTTMVGAVASVEEHFAFLWESADISDEQKDRFYDIFQQLRSDILTKGNNQIRNIDADLMHFNVEMLKNIFEIPVRKPERKDD